MTLPGTLVDEGLKKHKAAPDGKKGPITIGAWLRYAEQRVLTAEELAFGNLMVDGMGGNVRNNDPSLIEPIAA